MGELQRRLPIEDPAAPAGVIAQNISAAEQEAIVVYWTMADALAGADITTAQVRAVDPEGNVMPDALTPEVLSVKTLTGSTLSEVHRYDVRGLGTVELRLTTSVGPRDVKVFVNHYWG